MARDELGPVGGWAAMVGTMLIMLILIAVLGLVIVNAMKHSPWATATVLGTIPVAMLIGIYMRGIRPGRVLEGSLIGIALLLVCVIGGGWVDHNESLRGLFDWSGESVAWFVMIYGFAAATLPVWLLLAPRDYLSTFLKLGVVFLLAISILVLAPDMKMPALTQFIDGTGPIFKGTLFPFVFITIACGAISGFHSLVSSGTTPKMLNKESEARMIGYGAMLCEGLVGCVALIAVCALHPGDYYAINVPPAVFAKLGLSTVNLQHFSTLVGETLVGRTGGAVSLAVGVAQIFSGIPFLGGLMSYWYHFAIMFEALFILTTIDTGPRVGRFLLQEFLGRAWKPFDNTNWLPGTLISTFAVVFAWSYFILTGSISQIWPMFGIANQLLAAVALCVGTAVILNARRGEDASATQFPLG